MNVLFIGTTLRKGGGMAKAFASLIHYFSERNAGKLSVLIMGSRAEREWQLPIGCSIYELKIIRDSRNVVDAVVHNLQINRAVFSAVKKENPDVIISFIPDVSAICKIRFMDKCVVGCLRVNPDAYTKHNIKHRMLTYHLSMLLDGFVFQTHGAQAVYHKMTIQKSVVIPNGTKMPERIIDIKLLPTRRKIYASGRLAQGKRFDDIMLAFSHVANDYKDYTLVIIGTGDQEKHLKEHADRLGMRGRIEFFGESADPMADMIDGYIYVFASDSEGYPNALAEATMMGLPCVATNCDFGPADIIKDGYTGILVDVGDVTAMARAIRKLIENPELAVEYSEHTNEYRESHGMETMGAAYYHYVEGLYNVRYQGNAKHI